MNIAGKIETIAILWKKLKITKYWATNRFFRGAEEYQFERSRLALSK